MRDDISLLRAYLERGSQSAFAALVDRYLPLVYGTALRSLAGDTHAASDVSQQAFVALARNAPRMVSARSMAGWLHGTAHHLAVSRIRSDRRRAEREREADRRNATQPNSPSIGDETSLRLVLDAALQDLSSLEREMILLRYLQGWDYVEIARLLKVSEEAARKRIERALPKLREALFRRGVVSVGSALSTALASETSLSVPASLATHILGHIGPAAGLAEATFATLTFMTTTNKILIGTTVAVALAGAAGTLHFRQRYDALRTQLHQTDTLSRADQTQVAKLHTEIAPITAAPPDRSIAAASSPTQPSTSSAVPEESDEARVDRLVLNNPELQRLYVRQATIRITEKYNGLYRRLGLQPDQIARFEAIMADHAQGMVDVRVAGLTQGANKLDSAVQTLQQQVNQQRDEALRGLLGEAGLEFYRDYEHTSIWRSAPAYLAGRLYDSSVPLTGTQADRLVELLASRSAALQNRNPLQGEAGDATLELAKAFLSAEQLAVMRNWKEQIDTGQKVWSMVKPTKAGPN